MFKETDQWMLTLTILRLYFSDQGCCDVSCLEDWIFRVSQVSLYLEMLVAEGLNVSLSGRLAPTLLPPCRETPWKELKSLLDIPILMFLTPQVRKDILCSCLHIIASFMFSVNISNMLTNIGFQRNLQILFACMKTSTANKKNEQL